MSNLTFILSGIEQRPGMYLGREGRSLRHLQSYLTGYTSALHRGDEDSLLFDCFTEWVATRYRVYRGGLNGLGLILEHIGGDDQLAFDEFFRLWPIYLQDRAEQGREGVLARYAEAERLLDASHDAA